MLKDCIKDNTDILMNSETKINESFPIGQFQINGFSTPYRGTETKIEVVFYLMLEKTYDPT